MFFALFFILFFCFTGFSAHVRFSERVKIQLWSSLVCWHGQKLTNNEQHEAATTYRIQKHVISDENETIRYKILQFAFWNEWIFEWQKRRFRYAHNNLNGHRLQPIAIEFDAAKINWKWLFYQRLMRPESLTIDCNYVWLNK